MTKQKTTVEKVDQDAFDAGLPAIDKGAKRGTPDLERQSVPSTLDPDYSAPTTPTSLLELAVIQGADIDKLDKLMDLKERYDDRLAKKEFFAALARFQNSCPEIIKDSKADFKTSTGRTVYQYATLAAIIKQIKPALKNCRLSYRWEFADSETDLMVTCKVTHSSGHTESTKMSAKADDSGKKNPIQARGSALTYLQRYTLIGALGIATAQDDNDGAKPPKANAILDKMTDDQAEKIKALLGEINDPDIMAKVTNQLRSFNVERAASAIDYLTGLALDKS